MRPSQFASLFVVLCGVFVGWLVWQLVPHELQNGIPDLHKQDYRLERTAATSFEITEAKWLAVPWLYADFDLHMDVELGEHMDLDVLLRQVEPRRLGSEVIPFHGRFSVLRLSTNRKGEPWRSRDQALFEPRAGGADLAPGYTATVWVQARGRALRANVAGKWYPWFTADDEYGTMTLVAHGGNAVLKSLVIETKGLSRAWLWSWWLWVGLGGLGGALLALACVLEGFGGLRQVGLGVVPVWLVWCTTATRSLAALQLPSPSVMALLVLAPVPVAFLVLVAPLTRGASLMISLLGFLGLSWGISSVARQELHTDDSRLEWRFGPASGSTPAEALAQRVRGPFEVHDVSPAQHRVFLLGGQLLYNRGAPTEHLEPLLSGDLRGRLQHKVDVPCLPTIDGYSSQQWALFSTFYGGYRPNVIVFGVPRDEAAVSERRDRPRSSDADLNSTLDAARQYCKQHSIRLVLFTEHDLPASLLAVLKKAESAELPLVVAGATESPADLSQRLAAVIAPLLKAKR